MREEKTDEREETCGSRVMSEIKDTRKGRRYCGRFLKFFYQNLIFSLKKNLLSVVTVLKIVYQLKKLYYFNNRQNYILLLCDFFTFISKTALFPPALVFESSAELKKAGFGFQGAEIMDANILQRNA